MLPKPTTRSHCDLQLKIETRSTASLQINPCNARTHSKKQVRQIADSIRCFGFVNPVLIDADRMIIAGHGRAAAAKLLGLETVPVLRLDHLTEAEKRAYVIADNRLAELAGWDKDLLVIELGDLGKLDLNFDLSIIGFEAPEIDLMVQGAAPPPDPENTVDEPNPSTPAISRLGDLWVLGPHRLLCGDARDPGAYQRLMAGETARLVFTDPPYNVPINGHVMGHGAAKHAEFAMASGEMSTEDYTRFLKDTLSQMAAVSMDGALHYVAMDWRHMRELLAAGHDAVCVAARRNPALGLNHGAHAVSPPSMV